MHPLRALLRWAALLSAAAGRRPTLFFTVGILLLAVVIGLSSLLQTPPVPAETPSAPVKQTPAFTVGKDIARIPVLGRVRKETNIKIVALTPGQVRSVLVAPGTPVRSKTPLLTLTDDFASRKRTLEQALAENERVTAERVAAEEKRIRGEQRAIAKENLNGDEKDAALRLLNRDKIISESALTAARLRAELSATTIAPLTPTLYTAGTVEAIYVQPGDYVLPGDLLATVRADRGALRIEVEIDSSLAPLFDPTRDALLVLPEETIGLKTTSFSQEDARAGLFIISYTLSDTLRTRMTDEALLTIALPLASPPTESLIPLECVFQDAAVERILVAVDGLATERPITLLSVAGSFARITPALPAHTAVIRNRAVIAGDRVSPFQN